MRRSLGRTAAINSQIYVGNTDFGICKLATSETVDNIQKI